MIVRLADLRLSSMAALVRKIASGDHPDPKDLASALRRGEEVLPEEVRLYIAGLLDGTGGPGVGRPKTNSKAQMIAMIVGIELVNRVDSLTKVFERGGKNGNKEARKLAFEKVAGERNVTVGTLIKKYRAANGRAAK